MTVTFDKQANGDEHFHIVINADEIRHLALHLTPNDEEMIKASQMSTKISDKLRMFAYVMSILEDHYGC